MGNEFLDHMESCDVKWAPSELNLRPQCVQQCRNKVWSNLPMLGKPVKARCRLYNSRTILPSSLSLANHRAHGKSDTLCITRSSTITFSRNQEGLKPSSLCQMRSFWRVPSCFEFTTNVSTLLETKLNYISNVLCTGWKWTIECEHKEKWS